MAVGLGEMVEALVGEMSDEMEVADDGKSFRTRR